MLNHSFSNDITIYVFKMRPINKYNNTNAHDKHALKSFINVIHVVPSSYFLFCFVLSAIVIASNGIRLAGIYYI